MQTFLSSRQTGQLGSHWQEHSDCVDVGEDEDIEEVANAESDGDSAVPLFLQGSSPHSEKKKSDEYKKVKI